MRAYAIDNQRNFANEFEIWVFESKSRKDHWVGEDDRRDSITRADARRMIGENYLSPGDADHRGGANCFAGGTLDEELRREVCQKEISYLMNYPTWPEGACEVAVRL